MTNQLLNVENCVGVEPKKVVGQGFELRVVNYCHSLLQTELMIPTWYIFLRLSSNSNQILSKVSSCPFVVPDTSSPKESSVLRVDLVCLRTCWTLVLICFGGSRILFFYRNWAAAASTSTRHTGQHLGQNYTSILNMKAITDSDVSVNSCQMTVIK